MAAPTHRSLAGRAAWPVLVFVMSLAFVQALATLLPMLLRDDYYAGDAQQHVWWLYRFADPTLFPHDLIAQYYSQAAYSPPGYRAIFRLLVPWIDAQRLSELLAIGLAATGVVLAAVLGHRVGKKTGAAVAVLVLMALRYELLVEGGFPRSFGLVLLLAGMITLCRRLWTLLGVVLLLSALLYAPATLNLVPAIGLVLVGGISRYGRLPRGFGGLVLLGLIAGGLIAAVYLRPTPADIGRWYTAAEARQMPERSPAGRSTFFRPWRVLYFNSSVGGIGMTLPHTLIVVTAIGLCLLWRPRAVGLEAWSLLAAALAVWALAHVLLFRLYLPSRYTTYALPVFAMMWAAAMAREIKDVLLSARWSLVRRAVPAVVAACAIVLCAVATKSALARASASPFGRARAEVATALPFLGKLPVDTLIAAQPDDANMIPLRARRSVLTNTETSIAFHTGYYSEMSGRLSDSFAMLYATDWDAIDAIADRRGVSVFVLASERLRHPDDDPYYAPFAQENTPRIERGKRLGFAMLSPPAGRVLWQGEGVAVLRVGRVAP